MKTNEIPPPLRGFHAVFMRLVGRWDYTQIFDDFLTMAICCYAWQTEEPRYLETVRKYERKELDIFADLLAQWVIYQSGKSGECWDDLLGTYYEILKSEYKAQRLGQYFTPPPLCKLMANLTAGDEPTEVKTMNDPACGSGRMLLAINAIHPGKYYFVGQDLDFMCVKMTALNLMIHGCKGRVMHMNTLTMDIYSEWVVNATLDRNGLFSILKVKAPKEVQEVEHEPPPQVEAEPEPPPEMAEAKAQDDEFKFLF